MSAAAILTAGKAVLWFAVPLLVAVVELVRTRRRLAERRREEEEKDGS